VAEVYETAPRRRRRGRGLLIVVVILLLILLGGAFVADRWGRSFAEGVMADKVTEQVRAQKASSDTPEVTIEGFPFVTQVLDGLYKEIRIQLPNFSGPTGTGDDIHLNLLDIHAKDVKAPLDALRSGQGEVVAGSLTANGKIDYRQLVDLIGQKGVTLSAKDGKLVGSAKVTALGQQLDLSGTAKLTVVNGGIQVRFADVKAANLPDVPLFQGFIDSYAQKLALDLPAPKLPLQLKVKTVTPEADGLNVTFAADDVNLNAGGL
jgi:LmeA-like phospholipid-binding